jgi:hypothetical protein
MTLQKEWPPGPSTGAVGLNAERTATQNSRENSLDGTSRWPRWQAIQAPHKWGFAG